MAYGGGCVDGLAAWVFVLVCVVCNLCMQYVYVRVVCAQLGGSDPPETQAARFAYTPRHRLPSLATVRVTLQLLGRVVTAKDSDLFPWWLR